MEMKEGGSVVLLKEKTLRSLNIYYLYFWLAALWVTALKGVQKTGAGMFALHAPGAAAPENGWGLVSIFAQNLPGRFFD